MHTIALYLALLSGTAGGGTSFPTESVVFDVGPLTIDQIYRSMEGPYKRKRFDYRKMDWVTAYRTEVIDIESGELMGEEFFCHSQLQLDNTAHLMVTATGISEIRFPEGFGIPLTQIVRNTPLDWRGVTVLGMVLNNHEPDLEADVNIRITMEYLDFPDDTPPPEFRRLYHTALSVTREWEGEGEHAHSHGHDSDPHATCETEHIEGMAQHWIVPPGRQITRRTMSSLVPVDSTVHVALVHLHNYGVYMKITDVTAGEEVWRTDAVYEPERVQIAKIPHYVSETGFRLHSDHTYELETLYDNTSDAPVDAMAMMYLFYNPEGNVMLASPEPPPVPAGAHH